MSVCVSRCEDVLRVEQAIPRADELRGLTIMDKLIAAELAETAARSAKQPVAASSSGKSKKKVKVAPSASAARGESLVEEDDKLERQAYADEGDDDSHDSDFEEHGAIVPDGPKDPANATAAQDFSGRRVFLDGVAGKNGSVGSIIGWHGKQWEVELDRRDERILVASSKLRWLDVIAPPMAKSAKKKQSAKPDPSGGGSGKIKKKKKFLKTGSGGRSGV